jgi:ribosomal protein S18 acetylase RimI-like enzyme
MLLQPGSPDPFAPFTVATTVRIRFCREEDLPTLEWFGLFESHRELIRSTFEMQRRNEAAMLVAEVNGVASGQAWLDFARRDDEGVAVLWAVRVFPSLQNMGIGARMVAAAEQACRENGCTQVEISVRHDNPSARRFYERIGYCPYEPGRQPGHWVLRKVLPALAQRSQA